MNSRGFLARPTMKSLSFWLILWTYATRTVVTAYLFKTVTRSPAFLDRTPMIKEILTNEERYNILTAPHGFGKSTNLDMIQRFVELTLDDSYQPVAHKNQTSNYKLFTDPSLKLAIANEPDIIEKHFGDYIVIHFDFQINNAKTYDQIIQRIKSAIRATYVKYKWLYDEFIVPRITTRFNFTRNRFQRIYASLATEEDIQHSIIELSNALCNQLKRRVYIFVDNVDAPVLLALKQGQGGFKVHQYLNNIIITTLRAKPRYIRRAIFTGLSGLIGSSTAFSAQGLITIYRFLNEHNYNKYYGFRQEEMGNLLNRFHLGWDERLKIQQNYGGYRPESGLPYMYNPGAVITYLKERVNSPPIKGNYHFHTYFVGNVTTLTLPFCLKQGFLRNHFLQLMLYKKLFISTLQMPLLDGEQDFEFLESILNENGKCEAYSALTYFYYFYDIGYVSYCDPCHLYVPNRQIVPPLMAHLLKYFTDLAGISAVLLKRISIALQHIVDTTTTTIQHVDGLHNCLNEKAIIEYLYDEPLAKFHKVSKENDLNGIIYTAVNFFNRENFGYVNGKAAACRYVQAPNDTVYEDPVLADLILQNKKGDTLLFVEITFEKKLRLGLEKVSQFKPKVSLTQPRYIKFLAMNAKRGVIDIEASTTREYVEGEWKLVGSG